MERLPALSLAAMPGRRNITLDLAVEIEKRGFSGIYAPSMGDSLAFCQALAHVTHAISFGTSIMPIYFRQEVDLRARQRSSTKFQAGGSSSALASAMLRH